MPTSVSKCSRSSTPEHGGQSVISGKASSSALRLECGPMSMLMSRPNLRFAGVVDSVGFGVTPDPDEIGHLQPGLPDVQRTLNWVHLASRFPVRVRVENPTPDLFRIGESAVVTIRGN